MAYKKRYNLKELQKIIKTLQERKKFMDLEDLLFEIGYDPLDVNIFYVKNIKHRIRYEREEQRSCF
jgi:hypothetical protein